MMENKEIIKERLRKLTRKADCDFAKDTDQLIEDTEARVFMAKVSLRLLEYMESEGLEMSTLAEKLSVSPEYLNKFLRGRIYRDITIEEVLRFSKILGVSIIEIIENDDE